MLLLYCCHLKAITHIIYDYALEEGPVGVAWLHVGYSHHLNEPYSFSFKGADGRECSTSLQPSESQHYSS